MASSGPATDAASPDPTELLRSRSYVQLLALAALVGVPVSAAAYGFLALVSALQQWLFRDLPLALGLGPSPLWWPIPPLLVGAVCVLLIGATLALWAHYGTAVFFVIIAAGVAACF